MASTIKAIETKSVHQIQSGQVIVDLCSVVKELVENSLDAGATSVDVRFKNHGLDSIEIQDNGSGIAPADYSSIALKHYTSKLSNYNDLDQLNTFGFRGEALSSLCALSRFHIVTAREDEAPKGKRLDFEQSGQLKHAMVSACQKGTTVVTEELFYNLPVRRRELEKNIKREYSKVLNILHAYACISTRVRFSISNQTSKGRRAVVFATNGNATTKENISNVFGAKTLSALIALGLELELQPSTYLASSEQTSRKVKILGHISRPVSGEGRQTPDRQMFFVNSRPCGLPQIAKAFNQVYRTYNLSQSPFIFADLQMDTNAYDVNVSPDKRTVLLHDQAALLDALKESLTALFDAQEQTVPQSHVAFSQLSSLKQINSNADVHGDRTDEREDDQAREDSHHSAPGVIALRSSDNTLSFPGSQGDDELPLTRPTPLMRQFVEHHFTDNPSQIRRAASPGRNVLPYSPTKPTGRPTGSTKPHRTQPEKWRESRPEDAMRSAIDPEAELGNSPVKNRKPECELIPEQDTEADRRRPEETSGMKSFANSLRSFAAPGSRMLTQPADSSSRRHETQDEEGEGESQIQSDVERYQSSVIGEELSSYRNNEEGIDEDHTSPSQSTSLSNDHEEASSDEEYVDERERRKREEARIQRMLRDAEEKAAQPTEANKHRAATILKTGVRKDSTFNCMTVIDCSIAGIKTESHFRRRRLDDFSKGNATDGFVGPHNPKHNRDNDSSDTAKFTAEERLSLTISKSDFAKMRVVGQFNLGFILATRSAENDKSTTPTQRRIITGSSSKDDLFIIDQHASDEIYNFSRLSSTTTLTPQPLVTPFPLELTAIEEETILTHTETLAKNGFNVTVDTSGDSPVGQRCRLLTLPTSRETVFNTRDLEELVAMLSETTVTAGDVIRPSRVRRMLAMRACRSSIMVGKTLTKRGMHEVLGHMGEIERPWNCPHGRPTMRHLAGLHDWTGWTESTGLADDGMIQNIDWKKYVARS